MPEYTRVFRLLKILNMVKGTPGLTPGALAQECGVTERTIFRDMDALKAVGFNVVFDQKTDGYTLAGEVFLPPLHLTPDEALALAVLCERAAGDEGMAFLSPAKRALSKIRADLPDEMRTALDDVLSNMVIRVGPQTPGDGFEDVYERVSDAIATRRALSCRYESASGSSDDSEEFDFEPYALFFSVRAWYAVGMHRGRDDIRTLKLNRFVQAKPTDRAFTIPDGFSIDDRIGNAWRMIPGDTDYDVELRLSPNIAENTAETKWHKTQDVEYHDDGSVTFRVTVSGLDEIKWWVLSLGASCEVVKPKELIELVREEAKAIAAMYDR
jgi:proteasome accessory factor B